MSRQPLEKPVTKRRVAKALLEGESQTAIAERVGVTQPAISLFAKRHRSDLEAKQAILDGEMVPLILEGKRKRQERLEAYLELAESDLIQRGTWMAREPKQLKDEVVYVEKFDAAMYNALHRTLDDIAAEEGARVKAPLVAIQHNEIRVYDVGVAGSLPD